MIKTSGIIILTLTIIVLAGCGGPGMTTFIHDEYNFQALERVAVVPFDNLSTEQGAGLRATRMFITELLAAEVFEVVEPGEVSRALSSLGLVRTSELTKDQVIALGKDLQVQGIILGSVAEATQLRTGGTTANTATLVVRMVETDLGTTVWATTQTAGGRGFWASLFGTGAKSESEVMKECVDKSLRTLIR